MFEVATIFRWPLSYLILNVTVYQWPSFGKEESVSNHFTAFLGMTGSPHRLLLGELQVLVASMFEKEAF